jgi:hypothetical protein
VNETVTEIKCEFEGYGKVCIEAATYTFKLHRGTVWLLCKTHYKFLKDAQARLYKQLSKGELD